MRNVTFKNISMPNTAKGIYIKSNPTCVAGSTGEITDIVYEDVTMTDPVWWPIWIGPQQQQEPGSKLGRDCALQYPLGQCPTQGCVTFSNITLRRVTVKGHALFSPGVLLGNASNPMRNVVFEDVVFENPAGRLPFPGGYKCESVDGVVLGRTSPVPSCFRVQPPREE